MAWEELEARLFAQPPAERTDGDIDAYLSGPSGQHPPLAPGDREQVVKAFRNTRRVVKSDSDQREFQACQASIRRDMKTWLAQHAGADSACALAKASAAAAAACPKTAKVGGSEQESRNCLCERATVWKSLVDEAGIQELEKTAGAALAGGTELKCR